MEKKKNCYNCAYKGEIPGDAHIRCKFNWAKSKIIPPKAHEQGIRKGWYNFPLNYDPAWQIGECEAFSDKVDPDMIKEEYDPLTELLALLR